MAPGSLIVFEGPEGAGKSTQIRLLADNLRAAGFRVVETREPGGTPLGEQIRSLLLDRGSTGVCPQTEALLLNAARAQHVRDVIAPAIAEGAVVLCDRFSDSTLAYQGGGRGLPLDRLVCLQHFAVGELSPSLRVLLDLPIEIGIGRRRAHTGSMNRLDEESFQFHRRVRDTYLHLVEADPAGWVVVDASATVSEVARVIQDALSRRLELRFGDADSASDHDGKVSTRA